MDPELHGHSTDTSHDDGERMLEPDLRDSCQPRRNREDRVVDVGMD